MEIERKISEFLKKQMEQEKASRKKEKVQVCIKPNSYIGREIQYQTALMHEILREIRQSRGSAKAAPDKEKAVERLQRLLNANFDGKDIEVQITYEKQEKTELYRKAEKFAIRIMEKENYSAQELAILPPLLETLLKSKRSG